MNIRQVQQKEKGFTLLELLLVIVIVAIVSSAVVITMNPDNTHRELETEARRLAQVLRQLADESVFQGQEFGVSIEEESYAFTVWDRENNQWMQFEQAPVFRSYTLPEPLIMVLEAEEISYTLKKKNMNSAAQASVSESEGDEILPNAWFLSSGEITPFTITLFADGDEDRRYLINASVVGEIMLQAPGSPES